MRMDAGIDTGAVFSRAMISVVDWETTGTLTQRVSMIGSMALLDVLPQLSKNAISAVPQPSEGATYAGMVSKEAGRIDWCRSAAEIWRQVRAFQPWPGAYTTWDGKLVRLIETKPVAKASGETAGTVVELPGELPLGVVTGDGILGIQKLQLEGKKPVTAEEFLRGARGFIGAVLGQA